MSQPLPSEAFTSRQKSYVTYTAPLSVPDAPAVVLLEARSLLSSSGTTGFRTWEAALHLATFLFSPAYNMSIAGMTVLELGAGTGLLSILCSKYLGAAYTLATDGSPEVVSDLKNNLQLNGMNESTDVNAVVLEWGQTSTKEFLGREFGRRGFDLVIGSDVVC